jgi:hypothetical protein
MQTNPAPLPMQGNEKALKEGHKKFRGGKQACKGMRENPSAAVFLASARFHSGFHQKW